MSSRAVLVTRPVTAADRLAGLLADRGLRVFAVPTVATEPVAPDGPFDDAIRRLETYDWIALTSVAGVEALADARLRLAPGRPLPADPPRWAAVGPATRAALQALGVPVAAVAASSRSDSLPAALSAVSPLDGARILLPRADAADATLPDALRSAGAAPEAVVAYHTDEGPAESLLPLQDALGDPDLDAIAVASGSAVRGLLRLAGELGLRERVAALPLVSIGPSTSAAARELGLEPAAEAAAPTPEAIADAVVRLLTRPTASPEPRS